MRALALTIAKQSAFRVVWFGAVPAALTLFALSELVPRGASSDAGRLVHEQPALVAVLSFLVFVALLRYWRFHLPGSSVLALAASETKVSPPRRQLLWLGAALVGAVVAAIALRAWLFQPYRVLSGSMLPTLEAGDLLGARKSFGHAMPRRGDVIVFDRGGEHVVKRVIGLPGDRVTMRGGHPVINGREIPSCDAGTYLYPLPDGGAIHGRLLVEFLDGEAYLTVHTPVMKAFTATYEVLPGEVFVLGDNRNNSADSRSWNDGRGGGVPIGAIDGRARWFVLGNHRDGRLDFGRLARPLRSLELVPRLEGIDVASLYEGIQRCLVSPSNGTIRKPEANL